MWALGRVVVGVFLAAASGQIFAQSASFGLQLRVLPEEAAPEVPVELPRPPRTIVLPPGGHSSRLLYDGSAIDARRYYESALPALGFQLVQHKANGHVWERGRVRAEVLFYPVAGTPEATGIIVTMSSLGSG
jgi:hypothetical protein